MFRPGYAAWMVPKLPLVSVVAGAWKFVMLNALKKSVWNRSVILLHRMEQVHQREVEHFQSRSANDPHTVSVAGQGS